MFLGSHRVPLAGASPSSKPIQRTPSSQHSRHECTCSSRDEQRGAQLAQPALGRPHAPTAWNELTTFAEQLDAQRLPGFLACLHATNDRYTIACRRGAIQLYGRLGGMHPQLLAPHRVDTQP